MDHTIFTFLSWVLRSIASWWRKFKWKRETLLLVEMMQVRVTEMLSAGALGRLWDLSPVFNTLEGCEKEGGEMVGMWWRMTSVWRVDVFFYYGIKTVWHVVFRGGFDGRKKNGVPPIIPWQCLLSHCQPFLWKQVFLNHISKNLVFK